MQAPYEDDHTLFVRLAAAVYRCLVARFEECYAVVHESWLVLHRSPVETLEVVDANDLAIEPAGSHPRAELEAYTGVRLNYLSKAYSRALCQFPVLCERLEEVNGRALDAVRLRALCDAHDAAQPLDARIRSISL